HHSARPSFPTRRSSDLPDALKRRAKDVEKELISSLQQLTTMLLKPLIIGPGRWREVRFIPGLIRGFPIHPVQLRRWNVEGGLRLDRKSTRLNSSHDQIS